MVIKANNLVEREIIKEANRISKLKFKHFKQLWAQKQ